MKMVNVDNTKIKIPGIGMRIVKSAVGVFLCYLVNLLRGGEGIVFYSQLAVLWCMQDYVSETKAKAKQRTITKTFFIVYSIKPQFVTLPQYQEARYSLPRHESQYPPGF